VSLARRCVARCLLFAAALVVTAASATPPVASAEPAASAKAPQKSSLPSTKKADAPLRWDRLDPSTIERRSTNRAPKAPSFPAERS
jgi:hypothetical protein